MHHVIMFVLIHSVREIVMNNCMPFIFIDGLVTPLYGILIAVSATGQSP